MATYTAIPSGDLDPESPITTGLMTALDANVEGALAGLATFDVLEAAYGAGSIPAGAYKALSIVAADIATDTITATQIGPAAVGQSEIGTDAVHRDEISTTNSTTQTTTLASGGGAVASIAPTGGSWSLSWFAHCVSGDSTIWLVPGSNTSVVVERQGTSASSDTFTLYHRYIDTSPPWDLGDGEIPLFVQFNMSSSGEIIESFTGANPPWYGRGPYALGGLGALLDTAKLNGESLKSKIGCDGGISCFLDGLRSIDKMTDEEKVRIIKAKCTMEEKNRNMIHSPHAFNQLGESNKIVMIDPMSKICEDLALIEKYRVPENNDEYSVFDLFDKGYIEIDNQPIRRCGPPGVEIVSAKWKLTGGK